MGNLGGPSWVLEVIDPAAELRNAGGLEGEDINKEEEEREGGGRRPESRNWFLAATSIILSSFNKSWG